jgi:pimeloyl-ACP methyl ester carboxylesterase
MPTITLSDRPLFYARTLPSTGTEPPDMALVLLHGAGGSHLVWPKALRRMGKTAVYTPDLPGHGRSPGPGYDSIAAYSDSVAAFIDALDLRRVVLVGHSLGGAIAQTLAIRKHPALAGLVLIGTGARLRVAPHILQQIETDFSGVVALLNELFWSETAPPEMAARSRAQLRQCPPQVLLDDFRACDAFDVRAQLDQIQLPTLVISAGEDRLTPEKYGRFLADQIPHSQFLLLPHAAHMMMVEQETAVAAAIRQFMEQLIVGG